MKEKLLYAAWACLYILCVGLGFVSEPAGVGKFLLIATAVIFFLPGALLLYEGYQSGNQKIRVRVRVISIVSLGLTLILIIANVLSVTASREVGDRLYELLALVSAPMLCGQNWVLSLFLWACLLFASFTKPKTRQP